MLCLLLKKPGTSAVNYNTQHVKHSDTNVKLIMSKEVNLKQTTSNCKLLTELFSYSYLTVSLENSIQNF